MNSIYYKPLPSKLQTAYDSYMTRLSRYDGGIMSATSTQPIMNHVGYTESQLNAFYDKYPWLVYSDEPCFVSLCTWCHSPRSVAEIHELCDLRLYYSSPEGVMEQKQTLLETKPILPTILIDSVVQFLMSNRINQE
jgi:hypothetical protein